MQQRCAEKVINTIRHFNNQFINSSVNAYTQHTYWYAMYARKSRNSNHALNMSKWIKLLDKKISISLLYTLSPLKKSSLSKRNKSISWNEISTLHCNNKNTCMHISWFQKIPNVQTPRRVIRNSNREGCSKGKTCKLMDQKFNFKEDLGKKR